ncbi:MAG: efflux RND transporter periplasmic adaptor subunit [Spirochaetales bacterium]|nr:efflux RND transporter periplasmic adaptor subunit [Spirochaetales bacterium]
MRTLLLFAAIMLVFTGCQKKDETSSASTTGDYSQTEATAVAVEVIEVKEDKLVPYLEFSGSVQGVNEVNLLSKTRGTIVEVYSKLGEKVSRGAPLLKVDNTLPFLNLKAAEEQAETTRIDFEALEKSASQGGSSRRDLSAARDRLAAVKAALEAARQEYENCTVRSPIDGVIATMDRSISPGNSISVGTPVARIIDNSSWVVENSAGEGQIRLISEGTPVLINVPSAGSKAEKGEITAIASGDEQNTGSYKIIIQWTSGNKSIRSGMTASVMVPTKDENTAIIIPLNSVVRRNRMDYVFIEEEGKASAVSVIKGNSLGNRLEIISGLKEGDRLIISGLNSIAPGIPVKSVAADRSEALQ